MPNDSRVRYDTQEHKIKLLEFDFDEGVKAAFAAGWISDKIPDEALFFFWVQNDSRNRYDTHQRKMKSLEFDFDKGIKAAFAAG